jgi:hypothetical protein
MSLATLLHLENDPHGIINSGDSRKADIHETLQEAVLNYSAWANRPADYALSLSPPKNVPGNAWSVTKKIQRMPLN